MFDKTDKTIMALIVLGILMVACKANELDARRVQGHLLQQHTAAIQEAARRFAEGEERRDSDRIYGDAEHIKMLELERRLNALERKGGAP